MKSAVSPTQKTLNVWAVILIVWSVYRATFQTSLPLWFDELVAKPIVFLIPIYYYISLVEKQNFFKAIDLKLKGIPLDIASAFGFGVVFFAVTFLANWLKVGSALPSSAQTFSVMSVSGAAILALATSVSEEILSRGFVLKRLYLESKNRVSAVLFSSILFTFLHLPILLTSPKMTGILLLRVMLTDIIFSLIVSALFLVRKNLALPILIHALYNLSIYLFI
ncbi:CPBP family intramembrane metalloprotease [Candidatus Roizmanbacteria bacterium]|nr:CPBP family intramembrane metalloprotease [Candidatus Roizmanbacteria bacterium]